MSISAIYRFLACAALAAAVHLPLHAEEAPASPEEAPLVVQENMQVGLEYTLTVDGEVVDSTEGRGEPFRYVQGRQQVIVGLERRLAGLQVGDSRYVVIPPADGYGVVDPEAVIKVPKAQLPTDTAPEAGMVIRGVNPGGQTFEGRIVQVEDESVFLDLNHPLAGKTLNFAVEIVEISPVPAQ